MNSVLASIPIWRAWAFCLQSWVCGAAGSALPWHGRGRRFDPHRPYQPNRLNPLMFQDCILPCTSGVPDPTANGQLYVAMTLVNKGYGRVIRQRPATIVLASKGTTLAHFSLPVATLDLSSLASAVNQAASTFETTLTIPVGFPAGQSVSLYLFVPDPAPSLTNQAAYALPLNSLNANSQPVFDPTTGYNLLATFQSH